MSRLSGYFASILWDPVNIVNGTQTNKAVTVPGAMPGDFVLASFNLPQSGTVLTGYVGTPNTVTVILENHSGSDKQLAEGTLRIKVIPVDAI